MFQTKDGEDTAWATRFTITDSTGNPGTLRPVIPPGGKINPGGIGAIVPSAFKQPKAAPANPAAAVPASTGQNAHVNTGAAGIVTVASVGGTEKKHEGEGKMVTDGGAGLGKESSAVKATAACSMVVAAVVVSGVQLLGF